MAKRVYARRYAQAVFHIALEKGELDRWQSNLSKIAGLAEDASLVALLESPKIHFDAKAQLLSEQLGAVNPVALNLVYLLVTKGRMSMAGEIADEYQRLLDSHQGIERAEVITAVPLDDEHKQRLTQQLATMLGKKVALKAEVDPGIVGGIMARIGGKLLDGSTRSKLTGLKRELVLGGR
ncbi:ATP synthase F1 subunit delta [Chloroflexota bacterium]